MVAKLLEGDFGLGIWGRSDEYGGSKIHFRCIELVLAGICLTAEGVGPRYDT